MSVYQKSALFIVVYSTLLMSALVFPAFTEAQTQTKQSLSVTPPLFQLNISPGELWKSGVKVVNNNPYPLTIYANVVNFEADGETGHGNFVPILEDGEFGGNTLAEWISVTEGPYTIPPEQTTEVPFFVEIPEDAAPGGHFAAILISTEPPETTDTLVVTTSQVVSSLFFVRIAGDVIERADVREFSVEKKFVSNPQANFKLRIENKGNVHIQPRGNIEITNMWGKNQGSIPINNQSNYGNVLPASIREFGFLWVGDSSLQNIGRYKAVVTLAYGQDEKEHVSSVTYFWVIPIKAAIITIVSLGGLTVLILWLIRLYVRKMLALAGVDVRAMRQRGVKRMAQGRDVHIEPRRKIEDVES